MQTTLENSTKHQLLLRLIGWEGFDDPTRRRLTDFFSLISFSLTFSYTAYLFFTGYSSLFLSVESIFIAMMLAAFLLSRFSHWPNRAAYLIIFGCYFSLIWSCLFLGPDSNVHNFAVTVCIMPFLLLKLRRSNSIFFLCLTLFCVLLPLYPASEFFAQNHITGLIARRFRFFIDVSTFLFLVAQGLWFLRLQAKSRQLIDSRNDALRAALHFRKEITQVIAHDVKEPLATLLLGLRVAQKTEDPTEVKKHLSRMESTSLNIHRVLDYLMSLAIAEQDPADSLIEKTEFSIRQALSDMLPLYQSRLDERQIRLLADADAMDRHQIYCNRDSFTFQILSNLLANAVRAAPEGSTIFLRIASHDGCVVLEIENSLEPQAHPETPATRKPFGMKIVRKFCDWNQIDLEQVFETTALHHRQICRTRLQIPPISLSK